MTFTVEEEIPGPIFIYYELNNFYANHRDFIKSKIWSQLKGETNIDKNNNSKCEGAKLMSEMFDGDVTKYKTYANKNLTKDSYANPCGLIAKAYFTDEFEILNENNSLLNITSKNIAHEYDKKYIFKRYRRNPEEIQWIDVENGKENICNYYYKNFREIYCMDANGNFSKFSENMGED